MLCECVMMTLSVIANVIFAWSEHVCACSLRYCMMWRKRFQSGTAGCDITGFHFLSHGHTTAVLAELAALFYHIPQYITVIHSTSTCFTVYHCASQYITVLHNTFLCFTEHHCPSNLYFGRYEHIRACFPSEQIQKVVSVGPK